MTQQQHVGSDVARAGQQVGGACSSGMGRRTAGLLPDELAPVAAPLPSGGGDDGNVPLGGVPSSQGEGRGVTAGSNYPPLWSRWVPSGAGPAVEAAAAGAAATTALAVEVQQTQQQV